MGEKEKSYLPAQWKEKSEGGNDVVVTLKELAQLAGNWLWLSW